MSYLLANKNFHNRDSCISFKEEGHEYTVKWEGNLDGDKKFTSCTTLVHSLCNIFDNDKVINQIMNSKNWNENNIYWGMDKNQIKNLWKNNGKASSEAGTKLHFDIECFYNELIVENNSKEWLLFLQFNKDHLHLEAFRTEWLIWDEEFKITGSIDMVFKDGEFFDIYDWKRSKSIDKIPYGNKYLNNKIVEHLPDSNFWHYSLQLNIYRCILERKYDIKIRNLFLIQLHPNFDFYKKIKCADLSKEVNMLLNEKKLKPYSI